MISRYLPVAVEDPQNPEGRNGMAVAQYVAGMAFSNVGLGLVHGMAHPLGALFDIPHGVANAVLLPTVMEFNMPYCIAKYRKIAEAMGVDTSSMNDNEAAQAACDAVKQLSQKVGIPATLTALGIKAENIPALTEQAINDVCTPGNPRQVTAEEVEKIYHSLL